MCKRNVHEFPCFYGNDAHAQTVVSRPFFLAPAKTRSQGPPGAWAPGPGHGLKYHVRVGSGA